MASGSSPGVVGRQPEIDRLAALATEAVGGHGVPVLVEGEPGIGKTTMLDVAAADCAGRGMRVLRGAAEELEQRLPFATVRACLGRPGRSDEPAVTRVDRLLRGEGALGESTAAANHELAVIEAVVDLVDHWCAAGPVALLVDDIQWADASSVLALHRIARGIRPQPLLLVVAGRPVPRGDAVTGLVRSMTSHGAQVLRLAPLDEPAVATLVGKLAGAPPGDGLRRIAAGGGGNPMYVTELVAALSREGAIHSDGGVAEVSEGVGDSGSGWVPRPLVEMIMQRLDFLPREARETLQVAAVLGTTVEVGDLSVVLETSIPALSQVVVTAVDAGLLVDTGEQLAFRHDLIREALAEDLPGPVRTALHLRAGQVLAAAGAPVERVAEHLMAGTTVDASAVDWLIRRADQLIVRAPQTAVDLLRRALDGAEEPSALRLRLHLVRALLWVGSAGEAEEAARAALAAGHAPASEGVLRWLLVQACYRQGDLAGAQAAAEEALSSPRLGQGERGRFHGFMAVCHTVLFQFEASERASHRAIAAGEAGGDRVAVGWGYEALAGVRMMAGEFEDALTFNDRALAAFGGGLQPDLQLDPYYMRGYCLTRLDRLVEADEALAVSVRQNVQSGGIYVALSCLVRARIRFLDGRWDDALAEAQTGVDSLDPYSYGVPLRAMAALIAIHRRGHLDDSVKVPVDDGTAGARSSRFILIWADALLREVRTGPQAALDVLFPLWREGGVMEHPRVIYDICPDLARVAVAAGDLERAAELAESTQALAAELPGHTTAGIAQLCRALSDDDPDGLLAAAGTFGLAGRPLFAAYAFEGGAAILGRVGRGAEAREALDEALARYHRLDAAWDAARAEARLRQLGIRIGVRGRRKRPKYGWEALTDTENKVVALVAEGRSNPEIAARMYLSSRTVQTHVSNILTKLNASSRVELAIGAARRSPAAPRR